MIAPTADALMPDTTDESSRGGMLRWLVAASLALIPVQIETPYEIRFAPTDVVLFFAVLFGVGVWRGVRPAWSIWHVGLLGLFFVAIIAKNVLGGGVMQSDLVNKLGGLIVLFSLYVCVTSLADNWANLRFFVRAFAISVTLLNAVSVFAFLYCRYTGNEDPVLMFLISDGLERLAGMLVDPNAYGGLLCAAYAIVLLGSQRDEPLFSGWFRVLSLVTLSVGLFLTSSRSAWIGFALLTLFGIMQNPRLLLVLPVLIVAGIGALFYTLGDERFDEMLTLSGRLNTIDDRVEINRNAWQMFLQHPLVGGGVGSFYDEHGIIVHNSGMWFLAEFGLIGFTIFVGFIGWYIIKGLTAYRHADPGQRALIAGLLGGHLAMIGLSMGIEATYQRYWWFVMASLASAYTLTVRSQESGVRNQEPEVGALAPASESAS